MFWFVPYISDPVWNFTYVAYSLTSSKPAKNTKGGASDTPHPVLEMHILLSNETWIYLW
jgi:hypothetical protein